MTISYLMRTQDEFLARVLTHTQRFTAELI